MATATQNQTTDTTTVDATATTVDASVDNNQPTAGQPAGDQPTDKADLPNDFEVFASAIKGAEAIQLVSELKQLSESEATKRIDKLTTGEALSLVQLVLSPDLRKVLKTKLGESAAKHLVHAVCTKVQLATYEADDTARVQSLKDGDEGWGVYAQQAPLGGFGAEIGFVRQENKDGKFTTQRGAAGFYLRASDETRPADAARYKAGADAVAAFLG